MAQAKERLHAPEGSDAKDHNEHQIEQVLCGGSFAPGLEHGNHSNDKQDYRYKSESFEHRSLPPTDRLIVRSNVGSVHDSVQ
ncbi:MAG TPA: hypothetical protein VJQ54_02695 [Candidatus Sulfotelmatobacter sp.]|nr:hypothetical protein [Candidatus Sulfotelmatobacter sp.]